VDPFKVTVNEQNKNEQARQNTNTDIGANIIKKFYKSIFEVA
jgi:hypothetical protein